MKKIYNELWENKESSIFGTVQNAPELEQFHKSEKYKQDPFPRKVNLTVGAYRDENGNPYVLPAVRKAEQLILANENQDEFDASQFGPLGFEPFIKASNELLFGQHSKVIKEKRLFGVQCLSGTGALQLGGEFLSQILGKSTIYLSNPTWNGHLFIFQAAGFKNIRYYRYYDYENRRLDFHGMLEDLERAEENSIILLQACAHNPTGLDLSKEQLKKILQVLKQRHLLPFFDIAYSGFVSGDPEEDAWAIRHFAEQGMEMLVMQSFSKNMGLYNFYTDFDERIGTLTLILSDQISCPENMMEKMRSQLVPLIQGLWANPPLHGARIVHTILSNPELCQEWLGILKDMAERVQAARKALLGSLEKLKVPGSWAHIGEQCGFFSYTGLNAVQVSYLERKFHVYMLADGRINICGLNEANVEYVAEAFGNALQS